jgi:hypothetical protein
LKPDGAEVTVEPTPEPTAIPSDAPPEGIASVPDKEEVTPVDEFVVATGPVVEWITEYTEIGKRAGVLLKLITTLPLVPVGTEALQISASSNPTPLLPPDTLTTNDAETPPMVRDVTGASGPLIFRVPTTTTIWRVESADPKFSDANVFAVVGLRLASAAVNDSENPPPALAGGVT